MGYLQEVCGAVTGSLMAIGLKYGGGNDMESKQKVYRLTQNFANEFKSRNKSISCRSLLDCDISTPGGLVDAKVKGVFKTKCPGFVRDAMEILEKIK
jgi:C_GCAxxG_C_C family probable redox protein